MDAPTDLPTQLLTTSELRGLGFTDRQLTRMTRGGALRRLLHGVYVRGDVPDSVELRAAAVARVVTAHHVVVDRTAGWLYGVDMLTYAEHEALPRIETCALRGSHPTERQDVRGRSRDLAPSDVTTVNGVRVTTPLRTALDLGCNLERRDAMASLNMFARHYGITTRDLQRELPRYRRRRGVIQLRELLPLLDPRPESVRECWTLIAIHDAGLPAPEPQYWILVDGIPTYRLDLAYPRSRICVEYDGFDAHERTQEQREHDRHRRKWLRDNGWTVIVVRRGDFTGVNLDRWLRELTEALKPTYSNRRW